MSTRANTPGTGSIQLKLGFVPTPNSQNLMEFDEIFSELVKRSRPSLVSAPPVSLDSLGVLFALVRDDHIDSTPPFHPSIVVPVACRRSVLVAF